MRKPPVDALAIRRQVSHSLARLCLLFLALLDPGHSLAAGESASLAQQREDYRKAAAALARGDLAAYAVIAGRLTHYPLRPHLESRRLREALQRGDSAGVEAFLGAHEGELPAERLRSPALSQFAAKGQWPAFLRVYRERTASLEQRCDHAFALWQSTDPTTAERTTAALWLHPKSLPPRCDRALAPWLARGNPRPEAAWERFERAMQSGETGLAQYLQRFMDRASARDAALWLELHARPALIRDSTRLRPSEPRHARIAAHALRRLAASDASASRIAFDTLRRKGLLDAAAQREIAPLVVAALGRNTPAAAMEWGLGLPSEARSEALAEETLRNALRSGDWRGIAQAAALPPAGAPLDQRSAYWGARAAIRLSGDETQARQRFAQVRSAERSYYGFLAAERIGAAYDMQHAPLRPSERAVNETAVLPGIRAAQEFAALGEADEARREFQHTVARLDGDHRLAAAVLASRWGWHPLAISTVAAAGAWNDLELRFPVLVPEYFDEAARRQNLEKEWLYAIARQESTMNPVARSPAGAIGLMQVMPATAMQTARTSGIRYAGSRDLLDPATNVRIGGRYMRLMLDDFGQNRILAAAAYNAGPGRVRQWLKRLPGPVEHDVFVETIPFRETRKYVQNVLFYRVIYAWLQGRSVPMVQPAEQLIAAAGAPIPPRNTGSGAR